MDQSRRTELPDVPAHALEWTCDLVSVRSIETLQEQSHRTAVFSVTTTDKEQLVLKVNYRSYRWATEVFAYRNWVPAIAPYAPQLIASQKDPRGSCILMTRVPGTQVSRLGLRSSSLTDCYHLAGALLRKWHKISRGAFFGMPDENGHAMDWSGIRLDPSDRTDFATRLRMEISTGIRASTLSDKHRRISEYAVELADSYANEVPRPTFEDYTPGNWLCDSTGNLTSIIDFENTHYGDRMVAFARLVVDYFPENDGLRSAFMHGYGEDYPENNPDQLYVALVLYALGYLRSADGEPPSGIERRVTRAFSMADSLR